MLYRLPEKILEKLILPLSDMKKEEIREEALASGLSSAKKPDSQEICFLPDGNYADYVESVVGRFPEGDFIDTDGRVLGRHKGIIRYTVGQRKGLGIALGARAFVTDIDPIKHTVTLSTGLTGVLGIVVSDLVFSGIDRPMVDTEMRLHVKLRYTAPLVLCTVRMLESGDAMIIFDERTKCAPGQSAVFYSDGRVLFGGFIRSL